MGRCFKKALSFFILNMINELRIKNLAVVEDTALKLDSGLNVLTGSTGAGKSIILTAVSLLSGERARKSLIRKGTEELLVEGTFKVSDDWPLKGLLGMDKSDYLLQIRRCINKNGRNRIWINGILSTNATAKKITGRLFELHGQHKQQDLLNPDSHINYLDKRGDYEKLLKDCRKKIKEFRSVFNKLIVLKEEKTSDMERKDFLEYQYNELKKLDLRPGLKEKIKKKINRSENIHKFMSSLEKSKNLLDNSDLNVIDNLGKVSRELNSISSIDDKWGKAASSIEGVILELNEITMEIDHSLGDVPLESGDIEKLQEKYALIQSAERKYGKSYNELIKYMENLGKTLKNLKEGSDDIIEARFRLREIRDKLKPLLEKLSVKRKENADILDKEVTRQLRELGIKGALFTTKISKMKIESLIKEDFGLDLPESGWDRVEFMLRTNIGEDIQPLCEIVSGGELSRVTLVLRSLLVKKKSIPTLIFDEIDAGLGADIGNKVSVKMGDLAKSYQIICITHLAQIAAGARQHIVIKKKIINGRTISTACHINGKERVEEIARMLGGKKMLSYELASDLVKKKSARSSAG
ncbi:MAG: DNA repair protein RecN [Candidatus Krumholzibacteriota bacterium]|nr:DNA repair protein RecN [Candidatus Krumholzibacteriota bacterium]